jgi:hypothetical protein
MKETLKRLEILSRRLEALHKETAEVLAESYRLIGQAEHEDGTAAVPKPARPRKPNTAGRSRTRQR